jgi:dienelactone hydrolase
MNRYGAQDLAGNVREWCFNEVAGTGSHFILGGGWNDQRYAFNDAYAADAFDRSPTNGVRCVLLSNEPNRARLARAIETPFRDFAAETPVDDETFAVFLRQFDYDRTPLHASVDSEEVQEDGTRQVVSFDAAYGGERVRALLFLPRTGQPPYQTVVYFPGSNAIHSSSSDSIGTRAFKGILASGRAVMLPIYKGTYERGTELHSDYPDETTFYKDHVIWWAKDLRRSVDYLEERPDIDAGRLAYYGVSWGGALGGIMPAIETRLRCNVLYVAGMLFQRSLPEVDQLNYVPRVRQPTLMLNGEYDFFFPVETAQKPMFELLGTPPEHKRYEVYPGAHSLPRTEAMAQLLGWLDTYLGQVQ